MGEKMGRGLSALQRRFLAIAYANRQREESGYWTADVYPVEVAAAYWGFR